MQAVNLSRLFIYALKLINKFNLWRKTISVSVIKLASKTVVWKKFLTVAKWLQVLIHLISLILLQNMQDYNGYNSLY